MSEMIFLTYDCEPNPRDAQYYLCLQYLFHKTVNSVFKLDDNRHSLKIAEPLRRQHFHSWLHRALEYRRGWLLDLICHDEEALFRFCRDAVRNTNHRDNIAMTIVRKLEGTQEQKAEHGRQVTGGQSDFTWQLVRCRLRREQKDLRVPPGWAFAASTKQNKADFAAYRQLTRDYADGHWSTQEASGALLIHSAMHRPKFRADVGPVMFNSTHSRDWIDDKMDSHAACIEVAQQTDIQAHVHGLAQANPECAVERAQSEPILPVPTVQVPACTVRW